MISGVHALFYTKRVAEMQAFLRDALGLASVDAGEPGEPWPIFASPPAEIAVHPGEGDLEAELYLMCDDVHAAIAKLAERGVSATPVADRGWGLVTRLTIPGGDQIGLYQPQHPSPLR